MPVSAHLTPFHAAALNERSSLPPMSKTMPTRILFGSSALYAAVLHAWPTKTSDERSKITRKNLTFMALFLECGGLTPLFHFFGPRCVGKSAVKPAHSKDLIRLLP